MNERPGAKVYHSISYFHVDIRSFLTVWLL